MPRPWASPTASISRRAWSAILAAAASTSRRWRRRARDAPMAACPSARYRSPACCSRTGPPRPAFIDARLADRALARGRCRGLELLRGRRWLAGAGAGPPGHDRHAAQGGPRLPAERRRGDTPGPQHRGAGHRGAADGAGHARPPAGDRASRGPAARAGGAPARARAGRVLRVRPARRPRVRCGSAAEELAEDPLLAGARDFGRQPLAAARDRRCHGRSGPRPLFAGETPAQRRLRLAVCEVSDSAWREHPGVPGPRSFLPPGAVSVHRHRPRRSVPFSPMPCSSATRAAPTICSSARCCSLLAERRPAPGRAAGRDAAARLPHLGRGPRASADQPAVDRRRRAAPAPAGAGRRARPGDPASRGCARWPRRWA